MASVFEIVAIQTLTCLVDGQTSSLKDGEGHRWKSVCRCVGNVSVITVMIDGEEVYTEGYDTEHVSTAIFFDKLGVSPKIKKEAI